jgi:sulfur carrier protein ThiS
MLDMTHIDWVQSLLVPWIIFFALAAVASAFSILSKLHFFVGKMRSNFARRSHLSASAVTVHDALAQNDFNTRKIYAYVNTSAKARAKARASVRRHASSSRMHVSAGTWSSRSVRRVSRRPLVAAAALPVTLLSTE